MAKQQKSRGDSTRKALIQAAIEIFGRDGFHAASTREIARQAEANQAAIGYHFGGKDALYLAAIEHISERIADRIGPITRDIAAQLEILENPATDAEKVRTKSLNLLLTLINGLLRMLTGQESSSWAKLILREQQSPTPAFDVFYQGLMGQALHITTVLVSKIRGLQPQSEGARLLAITVVGQVIVFRASRAMVLRYMEWPEFSEKQAEAIQAQIEQNIIAMLNHGEKQ
jgi:AcrR family transcriptional regulator